MNQSPDDHRAYRVELTPAVVKTLSKLDSTERARIRKVLHRIARLKDPTSMGKRLVAEDDIWRYRAGDYRILCNIDDGRFLVLVVKIGHRREVYRPE